jgi:hypothetical protein
VRNKTTLQLVAHQGSHFQLERVFACILPCLIPTGYACSVCEIKLYLIYELLAAKTVMITIILWGSDSLSSTHKERGNAGLSAFFKA